MFKAILLPVDLSAEESWSKSAPVAVKMAKDDGIPLHVVTVLPDLGASMVGTYFDPGFEEKMMHDVGEKLGAWVNDHIPSGVDVHPHIVHGRVYDEIISAADRLGCDAIVMGSHRPGLTDYLLGPNAASVVRHAKQSVFVIRPDA